MDLPCYALTGVCPDGTSVRFMLAGDSLTVGRHGVLSLHDPSVSRDHAVMTWNGDAWRVTDVGSKNGTFVNGVAVQRKLIVPGDTVAFGSVKLKLEDMSLDDSLECDETRIMTRAPTTTVPHGPGAQALVGRSEALRSAMHLAARAAKSNATVLLFGESGTGKELFARLVWEESARADKKFVPVHSGAIEPNLLASTLFGHEKGAFTGADKMKKGLFEEADGGTIFLDEIGEISADTQVKLLRVLQEGEFMRVGGTEPIKTDVRVICATNRDLAAAVKAGTFREDLYYRLNVIQIYLPPLRERVGDIADLVGHYVKTLGGPEKSVSAEAMAALCRYGWPGNVRELRNVVERMVVLGAHDLLDMGDLPPEVAVGADPAATGSAGDAHPAGANASLAEVERRHIAATLESCGGNKKLAAERLGISRSSLYEKLRESEGECLKGGHALSERRTDSRETGP